MSIGIFNQDLHNESKPKPRFYGGGNLDREQAEEKKTLFISYSHKNINKVDLIVKELKDHPLFEPLVVANNREPNKALVKKVTTGIKSAYRVIALLTKESKNEQWINQEIGYAFGKKVEVIAIIEKSLLNKDVLKGFIHNQNDCPYTYQTRTGILMREENKLFMGQFRLLIKDLENKLNSPKKKDEKPVIKATAVKVTLPELSKKKDEKPIIKATAVKISLPDLTKEPKRFSIGSILKSGDECPTAGLWKVDGHPTASIRFGRGDVLPKVNDEVVIWKFVN